MTNIDKKTILIIVLAVTLVLLLACVSYQAAVVQPVGIKRITDIIISENSESMIVTIKGNQSLTYSEIKQVSPIGLELHFPDTVLDNIKLVYTQPDNEIIGSIEANEIVDAKTTTSRIFIALKRDTFYNLTPDEVGIQVAFPKANALSQDTKPQKESAEKKPEPRPTQKSVPAATRLKTVTATPFKDNVVVNVTADGAIKYYKSFTINNPARIVLDMYNLKSPYKKEQKIAVASKWVKRIRHFGYPDKVRLVLDTHKDYLSKYSALPTDSGLVIHIGLVPAAPPAGSGFKTSD